MQNASWGVLYTVLFVFGCFSFVGREDEIYSYTGVGLSALLVSTNWAMLEPFYRGTSDRTGSALFRMYPLYINLAKVASKYKST